MHPFLTLIYNSLYALVKLALRVYYRIEPVEGLQDPEPQGPMIVLSNHPNALIDPFLIVSRLKRPVFFLANASLFKGWFANWFLNTFYCIPVERPKDTGGKPLNNADAFQRSRMHLLGNGALYIAPEGTSEREYRLRPIKTGAARIALDVLRDQPDRVVTFLMGGIIYQDHPAFRSRVKMRFATLRIGLDDLPGPATEWSTVEWLTRAIEEQMQALVLQGTEEEDRELQRARSMLDPWVSGPAWQERLFRLYRLVHQKDGPGTTWIDQLASHLGAICVSRVNPQWMDGPSLGRWRWLLLPLVGVVLLHHLILFGLPELARRLLKAHLVYDATVRYVTGMIAYLVGVPLLWWILKEILPSMGWRAIWLGLMVGLGPWAWEQVLVWKTDLQARRFRHLATDVSWSARFRELTVVLEQDRP